MKLDEAVEILARTPRALAGMLEGISDGWARASSMPGVWSPYDILGHLIHGERTDWVPRARIIIEHGHAEPFEPFDREAMFDASVGKATGELLDDFAVLRAANLEELRVMEPPLDARGTHPELGRVTMAQLIATWAAHDLAHIAQTAEVMAKRYRETVGPWRAYLPVLDRPDLEGD